MSERKGRKAKAAVAWPGSFCLAGGTGTKEEKNGKGLRLDFDLRGFVFLGYLQAHQGVVVARKIDEWETQPNHISSNDDHSKKTQHGKTAARIGLSEQTFFLFEVGRS